MNGLAPVNMPDGPFLGTAALLASTLLWTLSIALLATAIGWPVGAAVARRVAAGRGRWSSFALALPICLPAYLVFWSVWHQFEPTNWFGAAILRAGAAVFLREAVLVLSMSLWAAPLAAWCVVAGRLARPDTSEALRLLDGAGRGAEWSAIWRRDRLALLQGLAVATLGLLGESVSFDLAQVRTYGFELRSLDLSGAGPTAVMTAGWPAILVTILLLGTGSWVAARSRAAGGGRACSPDRVPTLLDRAAGAGSWALLLLILVPPVALLVHRWSMHDVQQFAALHARPAMTSLAIAAETGAILAVVAVALRAADSAAAVGVRAAARVAGGLLLLLACLPATVVIVLHIEAWNNEVLGPWIYDTPAIVVLALLSRLGVVAVLAASIVRRSASVDRCAALDAPVDGGSWRWRRAVDVVRVRRPEFVAAGMTAGLVGASLAFSEIAVSSRLVPPGMQLLSTSTLNAIHYQQPETVLVAASGAILFGAVGAAAIVLAILGLPRRRLATVGAGLMAIAFVGPFGPVGCAPGDGTATGVPPIPAEVTFGSSGFGPGQFRTPRGVAYDEKRDCFYVVDKEARIQRFDGHGHQEREWRTPECSVGKPVGLSVHPDGRIFVADTHYHRVLVYDADGRELARFGSFGTEPGQFIYPTDVAFGNDGRIYVGEYGGNDRIQVFSPDLRPVAVIGSAGIEEGQFSRPQGLAFDRSANELYVADSNNHRVVVYGPDGDRRRQFGTAGVEPGQLSYPRGIVFCGDGSIMVVEFGNHRVQRFEARPGPAFGTSLGVWGGMGQARRPNHPVSEGEAATSYASGVEPGPDLGDGRLQYPWDMAGRPGHVMILDSGHDRVMIARLPT